MSARHRYLSLAAGCVLALLPAAAQADEPAEAALKGLVAAIDASPGWAAGYRGLAYDPATATATLTGLTIRSETGNAGLEVQTVAVTGYADAPGGGFTARSIVASGATIDTGIARVAIDRADLEGVGVPSLAGVAYDPARPFTSMMRLYSQVLKATLASARIDNASITEVLEGQTSVISYERMAFDNLKDGHIDAVRAGPLTLRSPANDVLVTMKVASVETRGLDIGAMLRVYDPDTYVGGVGDMVWHTVIQSTVYRDITLEPPGATLAIGDVALADFKVRQAKRSFADFFDLVMTRPNMTPEMQAAAQDRALDMLTTFGIGQLGIHGISLSAAEGGQLKLADFSLADASSDGIGEFAFGGLDGVLAGQGSIRLGRFAFGGVTFPSIDVVRSAIAAERVHAPFDPTQLAPTVGFFEVAGFELVAADLRAALGRLRGDFKNYVGVIPTSAAVAMTGLDIPAALLNREGQEGLARFGLTRLQAEYGLKVDWNPASERVDLGDFHVGIAGLGAIAVSGKFDGLTRAALQAASDIEAVIPTLSLVNARVTFTDGSIVDKGLAMLAEKLHLPGDKIRQQFADALPFLLSMTVLSDPTMMKIFRQSGLLGKVTPALKTFMANPGSSITLTLAPQKPVPLASIAPAVQTAPETVVDMLGLSVTADASAAPKPPGAPAAPPAQDGQLRPTAPAN